MDINRSNFDGRLLDVLEALSDAHFISFDIEMTGIPAKGAGAKRKQTMQERYQQVKEAAENFQILQIGLTCVNESQEEESYMCRSYNFNLTPHPTEQIELTRIFSCDSEAINFLVKNGFDLNRPFMDGVPYLSYDEEKLTYKRFKQSLNRTYEDIEIADDDTDTTNFLNRVRKAIADWRKPKTPEKSEVIIVSQELMLDFAWI
jgi:poly(A)-specific ribonuclease